MKDSGLGPAVALAIGMILIGAVFVLSSCASTGLKPDVVVKVVERPIDIPDQLKKCDPVALLKLRTQADVAKQLNRYDAALKSCDRKHVAVIDLVDQHNATAGQQK